MEYSSYCCLKKIGPDFDYPLYFVDKWFNHNILATQSTFDSSEEDSTIPSPQKAAFVFRMIALTYGDHHVRDVLKKLFNMGHEASLDSFWNLIDHQIAETKPSSAMRIWLFEVSLF